MADVDFAARAAALNGCGDQCGDRLCRDARVRLENALRGMYAAGLDAAADVALQKREESTGKPGWAAWDTADEIALAARLKADEVRRG